VIEQLRIATMSNYSNRPDRENGGISILIVDDDALNLKLFASILARRGYRVLLAMDAERGLELARQEQPDLIVMDIQLPGMSGLDAARQLKAEAETAAIPVIIATAFLVDEEQIRASACDRYLPKPFATADLISAIDTLVARAGSAAAA
jgi:two-component system cell cycle response regulator DivK